MKLRHSMIGLATVPMMLLAACGGGGGGDADGSDTFNVVVVGGLSGPLETLTRPAVNSIKASAADINKNGGINGSKVKVETFDGQGDPTKSVTMLQKRLNSGEKPDLLFLGISSTEALAMVPAATRAGIPSTSIASSSLINMPDEYPLFRGITNDAVNQLIGVPDYLKGLGGSTVAVVVTQDASGDAWVAGLKAALEGSGAKVKEMRVAADELDTSGVWDKVVADKPDMAYVNCLGDSCARILDGRLKAGATDIPLLGGISLAVTGSGPVSYVNSPDSLENADMVNYNYAVKSSDVADSEMMKRFLASRTGEDKGTSIGTPALAWDALYMFKYAADAAKSTDPKKMVKALDDGLPADSKFITRGELAFDGNILSKLVASDMAIVPATSPLGDDGRLVVAE